MASIATVVAAFCLLGPLVAGTSIAGEHQRPSPEGYAPMMNGFFLGASVAVAATAASVAAALWSWRYRSVWWGVGAALLLIGGCAGGLTLAGVR
ncbi:MAG: hypothetical protein HOV71_27165 [Hamadaea sp.]|nr:hypothetical protein [Hamadaea sp.]NUR51822.1 hypothetical protein [Hamadaea sp.]NUT07281.1 hypothetical protein [Hamadaea sp.]